MAAFLFAWNPKEWGWSYYKKQIEEFHQTGEVTEGWNCRSHRKIKVGDRAFVIKLGKPLPKGIIASGYVSSEPYVRPHYKKGKTNLFGVKIKFDVLLDYHEAILPLEVLNTGNLATYNWTPQSSGMLINDDVADRLEKLWFKFLSSSTFLANPLMPLEIENSIYNEGATNKITVTRYERNPYARQACIKHYGTACYVCNFDFEKVYGEIGKDFIHVHHLTPLSLIGKQTVTDPITDLRPVCPNCHAMIHSKKQFYSIEEMKNFVKRHGRN